MRLSPKIMAAVIAAPLLFSAIPARADAQSEMVVKAVMIRKFSEFIKWPDAVSPSKNKQVKVCVYGDSPMADMTPVFNKTSASSPIAYSLSSVGQLASVASNCHVLFISSSKQEQLGSVLAAIKGQPVLTVSDMDGFADHGGMIGFELIDGKIRYNINNKAFGEAQIKVDAQLLEIANKVVD